MKKTTRRELIRGAGAALALLPAAAQRGPATEKSPLTLWYRTPGAKWESEALPIGNGNLGAMVFGGVEHERLQLNEHSLWSGHPEEADSAQTLEYLPQVNELVYLL